LTSRAAWRHHDGELPIIEGALIRLTVDRLPGDRDPKPVWLWWFFRPHTEPADVDRLWRTFLRRFDIEHTFRFFKQILGWTRPRVRTSAQGDRWTWLIIAAHTQLRLARTLAKDLRRPCEKPTTELRKLTPARVRRTFRNIRTDNTPARQCTETLPTRARTTTRCQKQAARHPTQRRQAGKDPARTTEPGQKSSSPQAPKLARHLSFPEDGVACPVHHRRERSGQQIGYLGFHSGVRPGGRDRFGELGGPAHLRELIAAQGLLKPGELIFFFMFGVVEHCIAKLSQFLCELRGVDVKLLQLAQNGLGLVLFLQPGPDHFGAIG
jgi:hypothetical protein